MVSYCFDMQVHCGLLYFGPGSVKSVVASHTYAACLYNILLYMFSGIKGVSAALTVTNP